MLSLNLPYRTDKVIHAYHAGAARPINKVAAYRPSLTGTIDKNPQPKLAVVNRGLLGMG